MIKMFQCIALLLALTMAQLVGAQDNAPGDTQENSQASSAESGQEGSQESGEETNQEDTRGSVSGIAPESAIAADQARMLVEALRNDAAREALIAELEKVAKTGEEATDGSLPITPSSSDNPSSETPSIDTSSVDTKAMEQATVSMGRRLARITKRIAENLMAKASSVGNQLAQLPATLSSLDDGRNAAVLLQMLKNLSLVILLTYLTFIVLRQLVKPLYKAMGSRADGEGVVETLFLVFASALIDTLVVVFAWAVGYTVTLAVLGDYGRIDIRQTLYLNAFLMVELVKVAIRVILSPSTRHLRFIAISDSVARQLMRWLTILIFIIGYGQLLVVPIVNEQVSVIAGSAMSVFLSLLALVIALWLVLHNKQRVTDWLSSKKGTTQQRGIIGFLALHWHWPVILYLAALFVIVATSPGEVLIPVLLASGKIFLGILGAMIATGAITRAISKGVQLPDSINARLPLLERRLNHFVPASLIVIRALLVLAVAASTADVLGLLDVTGWLESQVGVQTTGTIISTALTLLVGCTIWLAITSWIDYRLNPEYGKVPTARETTLLSLMRNAVTVAILIITTMFALSNIGLDIAPLLASAGVLGLAIGFGAQKMVQDIITGVFIQFESAVNVGDVITVAGTTGTVERLTIRSVSLRDLHGVYHIIPFSSVDMVSNFMRDFAYFVCDAGVAYRENVDEVKDAMMDAFDLLNADTKIAGELLGELEWMGVTEFGDNAVTIRARLKTLPGKQWMTGRAYNGLLKQVFDERGIEMPFPHRTIYFGEDKNGSAPSARLKIEQRSTAIEPDVRQARSDRSHPASDGPPEHGDDL